MTLSSYSFRCKVISRKLIELVKEFEIATEENGDYLTPMEMHDAQFIAARIRQLTGCIEDLRQSVQLPLTKAAEELGVGTIVKEWSMEDLNG